MGGKKMKKYFIVPLLILVFVLMVSSAYSFQNSGPVPEKDGISYSNLRVQRIKNPYGRKIPGVLGVIINGSDEDFQLSESLIFYDVNMVPLAFADINILIPAGRNVAFARALRPDPEFGENFPGDTYFAMAIKASYTSWAPKEEEKK